MAGTAAIVTAVVSAATAVKTGLDARAAKRDAAKQAEKEARYKAEQQKLASEKLLKQQRAAYAASGVLLTGTPGAVLTETEEEAEKERKMILQTGKYRSGAFKKEGDISFTKGLGSATGSLLTGAGDAYEKWGRKEATPIDELRDPMQMDCKDVNYA